MKASTIRGAISKVSKETGFSFRNNGCYYKAKNACVGAYEVDYDYLESGEIQELYSDKFIEL